MSDTDCVPPREISPEEIEEIPVASTSDANSDGSQVKKPNRSSNIPEVQRAQVDEKNRYLALNLPPMYTLEEIYSDFAAKAMSLGFGEVLKHIGDRPLRVATVCSGTESPIMAMELLQTGTLLYSSCLSFTPDSMRVRSGSLAGLGGAWRNCRPWSTFRNIERPASCPIWRAYPISRPISSSPSHVISCLFRLPSLFIVYRSLIFNSFYNRTGCRPEFQILTHFQL